MRPLSIVSGLARGAPYVKSLQAHSGNACIAKVGSEVVWQVEGGYWRLHLAPALTCGPGGRYPGEACGLNYA